MLVKMKKKLMTPEMTFWATFFLKTIFYLVILFSLIYIYHFSQIGGSGFIYNEF